MQKCKEPFDSFVSLQVLHVRTECGFPANRKLLAIATASGALGTESSGNNYAMDALDSSGVEWA